MASDRAGLILIPSKARDTAANARSRGKPRGSRPIAGRQVRSSFPPDHPLAFWEFRDRMTADGMSDRPASAIVRHAVEECGVNRARAAEWTERLIAGRGRDRSRTVRPRPSRPPTRPTPSTCEIPMTSNSSGRYEFIRENIAGDIRNGIVEPTRAAIVAGIVAGAQVSPVLAREFADRFLDDVRRHPMAAPATPSKRRP
jgi:hypothetical protein